MKKALLSSAALLCAAVIVGCCSCRPAEQVHFPSTEISFSAGGGFSGFYSGYTIARDRVVTSWNGRGGNRNEVDTIGSVSKEDYYTLLQTIYDLHPESIQQQETGNMTTALSITSNDEQYLYTWEGTYTDEAAIPEIVRPLRDPIWSALQAVISTDME
jgi:hypothetical protein